MKMLDAGAYGIICPMVNTRADAERFVSAMRYPPQGGRSFGPIRALLHAGADYPQHANATVIAFAMVETRQALDNLDEILSVDGVDAVYIGPADLSLALGCPPRLDQDGGAARVSIRTSGPSWRRSTSSSPRRASTGWCPASTTRLRITR